MCYEVPKCLQSGTQNVSNFLKQFAGIWDYFLSETLSAWAEAAHALYVVLGPAFDYNADGLADDTDNLTT